MTKILKRNADIREYKITLEQRLEKIKENIDNPDFNLEEFNNRLEEFANWMRPDLDELVKSELLEELEKQVDYAKDNEEFEVMDSYSFGQKVFDDHVNDLSLYQGYYMYTLDNENALKGIDYHGGDLYRDVSDSVDEYFSDINTIPNESEKFAVYMNYGMASVFESYAKEIDMSDYKRGYQVDTDNITLGDVMAIHNAISKDLEVEPIYSKEDILKELDNDMDKDKDLDI
jgi:hypothetical protein